MRMLDNLEPNLQKVSVHFSITEALCYESNMAKRQIPLIQMAEILRDNLYLLISIDESEFGSSVRHCR